MSSRSVECEFLMFELETVSIVHSEHRIGYIRSTRGTARSVLRMRTHGQSAEIIAVLFQKGQPLMVVESAPILCHHRVELVVVVKGRRPMVHLVRSLDRLLL